MVNGSGISRYGEVKTDGYIMYDKEFVKSKGELGRTLPDQIYFERPKILVVRTRNLSLNQRIIATLDLQKNYNLNRLSNIIAKDGYSLYGLLGILNSKLFNWLYIKRFFEYEIKPAYLKMSPMADVNDKSLIQITRFYFDNHSHLNLNDIQNIEFQIDRLVYKLYKLDEKEISIIENGLN